MDELEFAKKWVEAFDARFERVKTELEKMLSRVEASILRRILADVLPALKVENGKVRATIGNMAKANLVDRVFQDVSNDEMVPVLTAYAEALLEIPGRNAEWYIKTGNDKKKVEAIAKDLRLIQDVIGLDESGELTKSGYLYRLGQSDVARERIKQFVLLGIASGQGAKSLSDGLANIVKGGGGIDGALTGYWRQYAFDTYAKVREIDNLHFANELGLEWFVYQGGLIDTSRKFCIKKNGKAFHRDDALKDWPKDPDLIDKAHVASYRPLIDRGRNNCRHFLMWVSEEAAKKMQQ